MEPDLDDTVTPDGRPPRQRPDADHDDTIIRPQAPAATHQGAPAPQHREAPGRPASAAPSPSPSPAREPARYAFRIGTSGRAHTLHTAVHIGRAPRAPRIPSGGTLRLLTVASASGEVSASHLEIRQLGASVVVTDLRSTNGSVVAVPGSAPHTLRQGESMVVTPGTLVDIGDGNVIEILPLQRHPHVGAVQHDTSEGVA